MLTAAEAAKISIEAKLDASEAKLAASEAAKITIEAKLEVSEAEIAKLRERLASGGPRWV